MLGPVNNKANELLLEAMGLPLGELLHHSDLKFTNHSHLRSKKSRNMYRSAHWLKKLYIMMAFSSGILSLEKTRRIMLNAAGAVFSLTSAGVDESVMAWTRAAVATRQELYDAGWRESMRERAAGYPSVGTVMFRLSRPIGRDNESEVSSSTLSKLSWMELHKISQLVAISHIDLVKI